MYTIAYMEAIFACIFLADRAKPRATLQTALSLINWLFHPLTDLVILFLPQINSAPTPKRLEVALSMMK